MARINQFMISITVLMLLSTWVRVSKSANKAVIAVARKEDIPFVKCQVCEKIASQLHQLVNKKQSEISPKKISEFEIIEIAENVCNLKKEEADWILKIDIVEKGNKLELVDQEQEGLCNSECKTIERACQEIFGYVDTDVAEYMYKSKPDINSLVNHLCKDLTPSCKTKPPPVPKNRVPGEAFVPKPAKEAEMEKMMRSMEGMPGAPGMKMYSREELMNQYKFGGEKDEEDDEDDDEADFPSNLAKALKDKENKKADWKHRINKVIKKTSETLKRHANKVSNRVRRWWRRMKTSSSSKNKKSEL